MALKTGFTLGNDGTPIYLTKGSFYMPFSHSFKAGTSYICGIDLQPYTPDFSAPAIDKSLQMKVQDAHTKL